MELNGQLGTEAAREGSWGKANRLLSRATAPPEALDDGADVVGRWAWVIIIMWRCDDQAPGQLGKL